MKRLGILPLALAAVLAGGATQVVQDQCGPFVDVTPQFCPFVLELYYLGITVGTSATTYAPDDPLTRGQAAVFVAKGLDQALARSSRRAPLGQWWTTSSSVWFAGLGSTPLPSNPGFGPVACDGADVWVGSYDSVFRIRASDGKLLETWTIGKAAAGLLMAMGRVFIAGFELPAGGPGVLYMIDPTQAPGAAIVAADLPTSPIALAFDGSRIWSANESGVSMITPSSTMPWPVTTITSGFQLPSGIVFDGQSIWVSDIGPCALLKLDSSGAVQQTVNLGAPDCGVYTPTFDGSNVLVPNEGVGLQVVRVSDGALIATVSVSGGFPNKIAYDGERILVLSEGNASSAVPPSLSLLWATDFATIQVQFFFLIGGPAPLSAAGDGLNFFIVLDPGNGPALVRL